MTSLSVAVALTAGAGATSCSRATDGAVVDARPASGAATWTERSSPVSGGERQSSRCGGAGRLRAGGLVVERVTSCEIGSSSTAVTLGSANAAAGEQARQGERTAIASPHNLSFARQK